MAMANTTDIDEYGCRLNMIPPVELFCRYEQGRFLYPAKRQRLAPVLPLVIQNWIQARRGRRGTAVGGQLRRPDHWWMGIGIRVAEHTARLAGPARGVDGWSSSQPRRDSGKPPSRPP
jgi:hypothetical protein